VEAELFNGLDALAFLASAPNFGFVEFLFLLVKGFFDAQSQAAALVEIFRACYHQRLHVVSVLDSF
jgi:hypothetical protein